MYFSLSLPLGILARHSSCQARIRYGSLAGRRRHDSIEVNPTSIRPKENRILLLSSDLHQGSLLRNIRKRYESKQIYVRATRIEAIYLYRSSISRRTLDRFSSPPIPTLKSASTARRWCENTKANSSANYRRTYALSHPVRPDII